MIPIFKVAKEFTKLNLKVQLTKMRQMLTKNPTVLTLHKIKINHLLKTIKNLKRCTCKEEMENLIIKQKV